MSNIYELFHYAEGDVANKIRNGKNAQNCPYVGFSQHISQQRQRQAETKHNDPRDNFIRHDISTLIRDVFI